MQRCISNKWSRSILLLALFTLPLRLLPVCAAQEVGYLDLTSAVARTQLRHPPRPEVQCGGDGPCVGHGGGWGSIGIGCGAESPKEPRALRTTLTWLDRVSYGDGEEIEFEVKLENVGTVAMKIPRTPHLADLQPADVSVPFDYYDISLSLQIAPFVSIGVVHLYGTEDRPAIDLQPGEWIRVRGRTELRFNDALKSRAASGKIHETLTAFAFLRKVTFIPHPGGYSESIKNLYPRRLQGPGLFVELRKPQQEDFASAK